MITKYSDQELNEFKEIIVNKMTQAKEIFDSLRETLSKKNNGTDDTGWSFSIMEDGQASLSVEENNILAQKQEKYINSLIKALERIENKTYGICITSGEIIPKQRLMAVPHTTVNIIQKLKQ